MRTHESRPTKDELRVIGQAIDAALVPVLSQYPGMEVVISYMLPRPGEPGQWAQSVVSTISDPKQIVILLTHGAMEVKQQLIDPFSFTRKPPP